MDTMKDTKMQPAKDAVIEELRMLAEDLYVNGYNRYSSAMSQAADEIERLNGALESLLIRCDDSDSAMCGTLSTSFVRDTVRIARGT